MSRSLSCLSTIINNLHYCGDNSVYHLNIGYIMKQQAVQSAACVELRGSGVP